MNENQEKTVYVFGAGASAACGVPVGKDFLAEGLKNEDLNGDVRKFLKDMYGVHEDEGYKFPEFEQVLTDLDYSIIYYPDEKDDSEKLYDEIIGNKFKEAYPLKKLESIRSELIRFICSVLRECWKKRSDKSLARNYYETYFKFIKILEDKKRLQESIFISLNYDLFLDYVLLNRVISIGNFGAFSVNFNCGINPDFLEKRNIYYGQKFFNMDGIEIPRGDYSTSIKLFKLHGSIDWYWCQNEQICRIHDILVEPDKELPTRHKGCDWDLEPNITYQSFLKITSELRYRFWEGLFRKARTEIVLADKIVFIGYSFPQYDYDTLSIFRQALFQNRERDKGPALIEVVNPDINAIEKTRELAFVIHRTYKTFEEYVKTL